jgi:3-oxoacyl-[acyl-carrier-protein] synthase-3
MRNFTYNEIEALTICTAFPTQKSTANNSLKSIAVLEQTTADLGFLASQVIIESKKIDISEIGVLILFTKTPDYRGPATAMVLQNRLKIPQDCIVYDSSVGNGGFENAVNLGASVLSSINKKYALVVFGDTVSKQLSDEDVDQLFFQDGATAILIQKGKNCFPISMSTMTLSNEWSSFMVPSGGFRNSAVFFKNLHSKRNNQLDQHLHIDYSKINIVLQPEFDAIKNKVNDLIQKESASNFIILINLIEPAIEKKLALFFQSETYSDDIYISSDYLIQTMASTIPIMLEKIALDNKKYPLQVISISLGEGLCINMTSITIQKDTVLESIYSDAYYNNGFVTQEM